MCAFLYSSAYYKNNPLFVAISALSVFEFFMSGELTMRCENCQSELDANTAVCSACGELVLQTVEGFRNTKEIERNLKSMLEQYGKNITSNKLQFVALLYDFIPAYDKERRLIKNMVVSGVLKNMVKENNQEMAIMNAKSFMLNELFISEKAVDFVLVCFTYMLGWPYLAEFPEPEEESSSDISNENPEKEKTTSTVNEKRIFRSIDAVKYRLTANISIPDDYTRIDNFCFDHYSFLRSIQLPSNMTVIGDYAFSDCKRLKEINLPDSLRIIGQGAFSQCLKLNSVSIPEGVSEIADNTFSFCQSLENVKLPSTIGSIGVSAFSGCEKLKRIFLPESIKFIDSDAFSYCPKLVIHCNENSYVHKYCIAYKLQFELDARENI